MGSLTLGILGVIIATIGSLWYLHTIVSGDTKPHRVTFGVWTLIGVLGTSATYKAGAGLGTVGVAFVYLLLQFSVFLLSLRRKYGKPGGERYDLPLGALSVIALIIWVITDLPPAYAATVAVIADCFALWPTLREAWRQPKTESLATWVADTFASFLGLMATSNLTYAALVYPVYLVIGNGALAATLVICKIAGKNRKLLPAVDGTGAGE